MRRDKLNSLRRGIHALTNDLNNGRWTINSFYSDPVLPPVSFPPCKASHHDKTFCREWERNPEHSVAALAWTRGGSALIVMVEVPPTGTYGGILGQVQGYELSVPDGRILTRFTASELKAKWQGSMNWAMKIPSPPEYEPKPHQK